jgi:hypothetical protein
MQCIYATCISLWLTGMWDAPFGLPFLVPPWDKCLGSASVVVNSNKIGRHCYFPCLVHPDVVLLLHNVLGISTASLWLSAKGIWVYVNWHSWSAALAAVASCHLRVLRTCGGKPHICWCATNMLLYTVVCRTVVIVSAEIGGGLLQLWSTNNRIMVWGHPLSLPAVWQLFCNCSSAL